MKKETLYTIIGTIICLLTMVVFLAFSSKLPERVPVQINVSGGIGNTMPKAFVMFGLPLIFAVINFLNCLKLNRAEKKSAIMYFVVPFVVIALTVATILFSIFLS